VTLRSLILWHYIANYQRNLDIWWSLLQGFAIALFVAVVGSYRQLQYPAPSTAIG